MMMISRSSRPGSIRQFRRRWVLFLSLFLLLLTGSVLLWRTQVTSVFWRITAPLVGIRTTWDQSRVQVLQQTLASLQAKVADRDVLYAENLELKSRLGRDGSVHTVLAGVLQRPPALPYDTLLIDAGSDTGVAVGDLVAAAGTTLIGSVVDVYATTARVKLFSAPGETYDGMLTAGDHTLPVSVEGQGAGSLRTQVPAGVMVKIGDTITLPGIAGGYVGVVSHVEIKDGESFEIVYMHLAVNPLGLARVEVWKQTHVQ